MFATKESTVTSVAREGLSAFPESRMEERKVSMLQAQKKPMPTWRKRRERHAAGGFSCSISPRVSSCTGPSFLLFPLCEAEILRFVINSNTRANS